LLFLYFICLFAAACSAVSWNGHALRGDGTHCVCVVIQAIFVCLIVRVWRIDSVLLAVCHSIGGNSQKRETCSWRVDIRWFWRLFAYIVASGGLDTMLSASVGPAALQIVYNHSTTLSLCWTCQINLNPRLRLLQNWNSEKRHCQVLLIFTPNLVGKCIAAIRRLLHDQRKPEVRSCNVIRWTWTRYARHARISTALWS